MFRYPLSLLISALLVSIPLSALSPSLSHSKREEPQIFVHNRILLKVNGKPISTFDLIKKMDIAFYRQYPEYISSTAARAQYYEMSWKPVLDDLIDKELVLADAEAHKVEVSNGDVRQEIELAFGPNVIANLDRVGLSFEEASKMMREEILINRMISGKVHVKAVRQVTPQHIRMAYETFIRDPAHAQLAQWRYRMITVAERTAARTEALAQAVHAHLLQGIPPDQLTDSLKDSAVLGRKGKITLSESLTHNEQEITPLYRDFLSSLEPGHYTMPFSQKSRSHGRLVWRILYLEETIPRRLPSFKEMESTLKNQLLERAIEDETSTYLRRLRQYYHVQEGNISALLPSDYHPFVIR